MLTESIENGAAAQQAGGNTNLARVFESIARAPQPVSVSDIADATSLSASTLSRIINKMLGLHLICDDGKQKTKNGRNKVLYTLNGRYRHVVAIFIDKETVSLSLADFCGRTVDSAVIPTKGHSNESLLEQICGLAQSVMERWFCDTDYAAHVGCIGICVSGTVTAAAESAFVTVADLPDWKNMEIMRFFEERLGIATFVEKDTVACLVGVKRLPVAQGKETIAFVRIDVGIGCAIMINNQIHRGHNNFAGEIRNMVVESFRSLSPLSPPDPRGAGGVGVEGENLSPLERTYGVRNILNRACELCGSGRDRLLTDYLRELHISARDASDLELWHLDAAARMGDPWVIQLLHEPIQIWASQIINLCCCVAPDLIMIGGKVHSETPYLIGSIRRLVETALGQPVDLQPVSSRGFLENAINSYAVTCLYDRLQTGYLRSVVY